MSDHRWIVSRTIRSQPRHHLYCFPHAGGSATDYLKIQDYLPESIQVYGVQPPGRANRIAEAPLTSIEQFLEAITDHVAFKPPFSLLGHSFGALLAFEVCRSLSARDADLPSHLFVSGRGAPQIQARVLPAGIESNDEIAKHLNTLFDAIPAEVLAHQELLDLVIPALRADCVASDEYAFHPREPLPVPISVLAGDRDATQPDQLHAWAPHTSESFDIQFFPGHHFFIFDALQLVAQSVEVALDLSAPRI